MSVRRLLLRMLMLGTLGASCTAQAMPRSNAVFVLSSDEPGRAPFAEPARAYYHSRLDPGRDLLVTGARSLQEVREWLARSSQRAGQPWGEVTLVAHGSPWVGLAVPLFLGEATSDRSALEHAIEGGTFPPLGPAIIDASTRLRIDSCGVGQRPDLLRLYAELFSGRDGETPAVGGSTHWIEFGSRVNGTAVIEAWRRERAFVAEVVPHAVVDAKREQRLRTRLSSMLASQSRRATETSFAQWRLAPVRIETEIVEQSMCTRLSPRALSGHAPVQRKLRDHGMRTNSLAWRVRWTGERCALIGEGTMATLGTGSWPAGVLPGGEDARQVALIRQQGREEADAAD